MHYDIIQAAIELKVNNSTNFIYDVLKNKFNNQYLYSIHKKHFVQAHFSMEGTG